MNMRKRQMVYISAEDIMALLTDWRNFDYVRLPYLESCVDEAGNRVHIPKDAKAFSVYYNSDRRCFSVHLFHESFPEILDGDTTPVLTNPEVTVRILRIQNPSTDMVAPIVAEFVDSDWESRRAAILGRLTP